MTLLLWKNVSKLYTNSGYNPDVSASYRYINFVTAGTSVGIFPLAIIKPYQKINTS